MLDGSSSGEINALAILAEGEHYVSGGEDKIVKVWDYDEGIQYFRGTGHSGAISKVSNRHERYQIRRNQYLVRLMNNLDRFIGYQEYNRTKLTYFRYV